MIIALLSDIHANLPALRACLQHARERGAGQFVFLGDLVGYGPDPEAVIDAVRSIPGALILKGNHDHAVEVEPKSSELNDLAYSTIEWTRTVLSAEQRQFLASLPLIVREEDRCFVHASASQPQDWEYVQDSIAARESMDAAKAQYVFSGHVHDQTLYFRTQPQRTSSFKPVSGSTVPVPSRHQWLAIVGSVGQPRDGNPAAAYALFDETHQTLTFFRVPYDHLATARKIRAVGLPEVFAERIERAF
ncbi:MAG TPA: metallophosphoesterase family protein [Polyangiaceae bacterium]|nr:metallophosphoesterase family protein [Polyangiaceae bacterium]